MSKQPDPRRLAVIAEARTWIGTPFRHQAAVKGAGADCGGLVRGVGEAAGVLRIDPVVWRRLGNYGRLPNPRRMRKILETFLVEIPPAQATRADILWLQWRRDLPMHLAIAAEAGGRRTMIHALSTYGFVAEHGLTNEWLCRVHSTWRYPGLVGAA